MKKISALTAVALMFGLNNVHASGYQLNEWSATGLGRSFAGMGVMGDDYSAMGFNPAGMTLVKRSGFQVGLDMTQIYSKAKGKDGTDKMNYFVPLPSALGQYNVNDKLFLGFGVYVPYGLSTKYKYDSHVAQAISGVRKSELEVIDANFSAAYKFTSKLSLGASFIIRYIKGSLTSNVNANPRTQEPAPYFGYSDYRVKGWTTTWQLGAMYEFNEDTRIGLAYRFKSTQRPTGKQYIDIHSPYSQTDHDITMKYKTFSEPELPASWIVSGYHKFAPQWGTSFAVKYVQWHRFYTFPARSENPSKPVLDVNYKWKDAWTISLGQEYYMNENWTLRAGTAWDQSPSRSNTYRTNRIPDSDRIWLSLGASYMTGNHEVDFGYAYLTMVHGKTNNKNRLDPQFYDAQVKYHNHSNMFMLQYQYKF